MKIDTADDEQSDEASSEDMRDYQLARALDLIEGERF